MKQNVGHLIQSVEADSIAAQLGIEPGDRLISIDGKAIEDILDYRLALQTESLVLLTRKPDGEEWEYDIENAYEDLGLEFDSPLMSEYRSCCNDCIFCFISQMPPGLRETLYFKDDDSRLGFLQGNYVTLTNMSEHDVDRIIAYRLEPVNISVHTTNPELRCRMMHNRFAGESLRYLKRFADAGISMNGQIVLCPGYNDGEELKRSIADLMQYSDTMQSLSVVPVGLTRYRADLTELKPVDAETAAETIDIIEAFQKEAMAVRHHHFVHASDELYLLAGREMPEESRYDGYLQLENGVGMLRLLEEEFRDAEESDEERKMTGNQEADANAGAVAGVSVRKESEEHPAGRKNAVAKMVLATGRLAAPFLRKLLTDYPQVEVMDIRNDFFGESITVSGLITGQDLTAQLRGRIEGRKLLLPVNMFRSGEEVLLDDYTKERIEKELKTEVVIVGASGYDLYNTIHGETE